MLARLLCFLLGHLLLESEIHVSRRVRLCVGLGKCERCGATVAEVYDLQDDDWQQPT